MCGSGIRKFLSLIVAALVLGTFFPMAGAAEDSCVVKHPLMPPDKQFSGQCPNCGMTRAMWARTWKSFENSDGTFQTCSFHCMADMALKSGEEPRRVSTALYLDPKTTVSAEGAFFVIGSRAKGTMTMTSKAAFPSKSAAEKFAKSCGGSVVGFLEALKVAKSSIPKEHPMLAKRRLKKGVIVNPVDNKDRCAVCEMFPARYDRNRCQIISKKKEAFHFCSTRCLFTFLADPSSFVKTKMVPFRIWVTDYADPNWIGGKTAYYVVGSRLQGPMGREAFTFDRKTEARAFAAKEGGTIVLFPQVTIDAINADK